MSYRVGDTARTSWREKVTMMIIMIMIKMMMMMIIIIINKGDTSNNRGDWDYFTDI